MFRRVYLKVGIIGFIVVAFSGCFDPYFVNTCFLPGTAISTPTGFISIENIKLGDTVLSFDETTGTVVDGIVEKIMTRQVASYLEFSLSSDRILRVTADHPLAVMSAEGSLVWTDAGNVLASDHLFAVDDDKSVNPLTINEIRAVEEETAVYNLKVRRYHNSFAEGVLSHFYFQNSQQKREQDSGNQ